MCVVKCDSAQIVIHFLVIFGSLRFNPPPSKRRYPKWIVNLLLKSMSPLTYKVSKIQSSGKNSTSDWSETKLWNLSIIKRVYFTGLRNGNIGRREWDRVGIARIEATISSQIKGNILADITIKVAVNLFWNVSPKESWMELLPDNYTTSDIPYFIMKPQSTSDAGLEDAAPQAHSFPLKSKFVKLPWTTLVQI